jgi:hypothetical protein
MGKHETGYSVAPLYCYPTKQSHPIDALAHHLPLRGTNVWECASAYSDMARDLRRHEATVYTSDIVDYGAGQDAVIDFLSGQEPPFDFDLIITNPPGGPRNTTAVKFIERGLEHVAQRCATLALLLPADFDSARTRRHLFVDCPFFSSTIVLTRRIVWFERQDGKREAPKENHRWFVWRPDPERPPVHLYDPESQRSATEVGNG